MVLPGGSSSQQHCLAVVVSHVNLGETSSAPEQEIVLALSWDDCSSASSFPTGGPRMPSACFSHPCQNAGSCLEMEQGYICECQEGYTGQDCRDSEYQGVSLGAALVLLKGSHNSPGKPVQGSWTEQ